MNKFTSFLAPLMQAYVSYQKASRHWNEASYEPNLVLFDRCCKKQYPKAALLSQEMVDEWCHKRDTETNNSCRSRIYVVVSFIRYLRKRNKTDVVEPTIPRKERGTYIPHSFTDAELENFFRACDSLPSAPYTPEQHSRKITIPVFFRLLYSSGIRTNEARMLRVVDVDLCHGILNIRYSKGHAQHYVVLHDSMLELLKRYDAAYASSTLIELIFSLQGATLSTQENGYRQIFGNCGINSTALMLLHMNSDTIMP
jgi:site-specific recombinase XerD